MPFGLTTQQVIYLAILVVAFAILITERLRNDLVAVLIVLALYLTRVLEPKDALAGFGSEPAIVVVGIFVLSAALHQTGVSELIVEWVGRLAGSSFNRALAVIMPAVALLSAFTHHLTTTAVMLPVTLKLARDKEITPSRLLMPLSFAASLGTTITIIGAPAFLLASNALQQAGRPGLGVFSIAPIGLALSLAGTLFMLLVGRFLLPERQGGEDRARHFQRGEYFTEVTVLPRSPFLGKTVAEVEEDRRYHVEVEGLLRGERRLDGRAAEERVREGDVLLVRTTPDQMVTFRQEAGVELHPLQQYEADLPDADGDGADDPAEQFVQAVVSPNANLVGRTLRQVDFKARYGAVVVSVSREEGKVGEELAGVKLRGGDVLVLRGDAEALARVADDRDFLMLAPLHAETRPRRKAPLAAGIMVVTIVAAAFNWLSIEMAALAGAVAMVLTGCLTVPQAYRAIDARIYVFIAGAIPLGTGMQKSGASDWLAGRLQGVLGGWNEWLVLLAIFAVVGVLTQFMSDAATTAIFAPVAIALAQALGHPPEAYVVTVAMAAVASFLTPIGHHGNLLVYGPGRYRFADFVRVGTPLTVVVALVVTLVAPLLWRS